MEAARFWLESSMLTKHALGDGRKRQKYLAVATLLVILGCSPALLGESANANSNQPAPSAEALRETLVPDWQGRRAKLAEKGFDYTITYIGEVLGNVSGGLERGVIYEGLLKVQLDFDTEKLGAWKSGTFHVSALCPHGEGLSERYLGDLFTLSNIDSADTVRLFELWYQHQFFSEWFSVRAGLLAADEEFASTDTGAAFINGTVGWPAVIALNTPAPAYPVATPGVRLAFDLGRGWSLATAAYNGDPSPADCDGNELNPHGMGWSLRDVFCIAELKRQWNNQASDSGLLGQAKFGGWYHSGQFDHQRLDDTGGSLADPTSTGRPLQLHGNWGCYLTAEQQVWRESTEASNSGEGAYLFARFGGTPGDRSPLEIYAEGGVTYLGLLPGRDNDVFGLATVYGQMSREARRLVDDCNHLANTFDPLPDYELVLEATYRMFVRAGVSIQPVVAYLVHPGGSAGANALVLGWRFNLEF